jgi:hypothetical protein
VKLSEIQIAALRAFGAGGESGVSMRHVNYARVTRWSLVKKGLLVEHRVARDDWRLYSITEAGRAVLSEIDRPT